MNKLVNNDVINPYPGASPFQDREADRQLYFGREQDSKKLCDLVFSESQVVLFSRSGLGKTSLINAGLLDQSRKRGYFPVVIRPSQSNENDPIRAIKERLEEEAKKHDVVINNIIKSESLWKYFRHAQFEKSGKHLQSLLIIDQFEELFTIVSKQNRECLLGQLADLVRQRVPKDLRNDAVKRLEFLSDNKPDNEKERNSRRSARRMP